MPEAQQPRQEAPSSELLPTGRYRVVRGKPKVEGPAQAPLTLEGGPVLPGA